MYNLELEQTVLGCMIIDYNCSKETRLLDEGDFINDTHKVIHKTIRNLVEEGQNVDYMTIYNRVNKQMNIEFLIKLTEGVPTTRGFKNYVEQLKDLTLKRKVIDLAESLKYSELTGKELTIKAEKEIFKLREDIQIKGFTETKDIVLRVFSEIEENYKNEGLRGVSTGYAAIDKLTDGLRRKDLIYLAARPSMGKTALAINMAQNISNQGKTTAIFSFEMSEEQLMQRMILSESFVSDEKIRRKQMDSESWESLTRASQAIYQSKINICDKNGITVPEMTSMCRRLKRQSGLELVIVDYLQMIKSTEKGSRREKVEEVSRSLKGMAKELDVPVLVISSLSRASEMRSSNKPQMSDLRETGQLEFDADVIMFIHREEYYEPTPENKGEAEVIFAKNRNGPVGIVKLGWIAQCTKFIDYAKIEKYKRPI